MSMNISNLRLQAPLPGVSELKHMNEDGKSQAIIIFLTSHMRHVHVYVSVYNLYYIYLYKCF